MTSTQSIQFEHIKCNQVSACSRYQHVWKRVEIEYKVNNIGYQSPKRLQCVKTGLIAFSFGMVKLHFISIDTMNINGDNAT